MMDFFATAAFSSKLHKQCMQTSYRANVTQKMKFLPKLRKKDILCPPMVIGVVARHVHSVDMFLKSNEVVIFK